MYYLWTTLLILALAAAWSSTLFTLPGNWVMAGLAALFAWLVPGEQGEGVQWLTVGIVAALAGVGELIEFLAGAAGAKKQGASRRAMLLALIGTVAGSLAGAFVTLPIPLVGPIIGAIGGGAIGAFGGAYLGEEWKGSGTSRSLSVGKGAMIGRLLGTFGKLLVGTIILVVITVDALV